MNSVFLFLSLITLVISPYDLTPDIPEGYTIAPWYKFKPSVITYSYDDGSANHLKVAVPLMDKYGFKGSFNLITCMNNDYAAFQLAAENGHEIASHTITHKNLMDLSIEEQEKEVSESKYLIEEKIGQDCVTLVYPYCAVSDQAVLEKYYISARRCSWDYISSNPTNMYKLGSFVVGNETTFLTAKDLNKIVDKSLQKKTWVVFLIHGIDDDGGYSHFDSKELEQHFEYVKKSDQFWVGTFRDVSKYILEANSLVIKEAETTQGIYINVDTYYKTTITNLDFPVTISKVYECSQPYVIDTTLGSDVELELEDGKVIFDVVPEHNYILQCED